MTAVDRITHTLGEWRLVWERTTEDVQAGLDGLPAAAWWYTDGRRVYPNIVYNAGRHVVSHGKHDTYSVEGGNADLRHYVAALAQKTRCFPRAVALLHDTLKLMITAYNRQQLHNFRYPRYPRALTECVI